MQRETESELLSFSVKRHQKMKVGIFAWYGYELPTPTRLAHIKRAGFDSTMLWWSDEPAEVPDFDNEDLETARRIDLAVENVHVPYENATGLWSAVKTERMDYETEQRRHLRYCRHHGIPMIVMHVSKKYDVLQPNPSGIETMRRLVTQAEKEGVEIAIENCRVVSLVEALLDEIDNECFGLCYDTSHGRLYEEDDFYLLKKYSHKLKCVHVSDNDGLEDTHWNPGKGVIDWDLFTKQLQKARNLKTLSLEVFPKEESISEETFLDEAYEGACRLRRSIEAVSA